MPSRRKKITVPLSSFLAARIDADGQALFQGTVSPPATLLAQTNVDWILMVQIQHIALFGWLDPRFFSFPSISLRGSCALPRFQ